MSEHVIAAIEMSQRRGSVAVRVGQEAIHVDMLRDGRAQDEELMPALGRLLERCGKSASDVHGIGVSIGPGSFTGLRVAIASVKMIGETLGVQVAAVPSALIAAWECKASWKIVVGLASKGETMWATTLKKESGGWEIVGKPGLADAESLELEGVEVVVADSHIPAGIRARCEAKKIKIEEPIWDAGNCLAITECMIARGETIDAMALRPIYPREPEAVTLWERRVR